jgi:antitoxin YefM
MNNTLTTSQARANLYQLVKQANQMHEPIHIIGKHNNAVLIAEDDWQDIEETLQLQSIPAMQESIEDGIKTSVKDCAKKLNW